MEGYLIRLPPGAWGVEGRAKGARRASRRVSSRSSTSSLTSAKPQAKLLYYVLAEGFLRGYATKPTDEDEPLESFQLTSFKVDVEAVYSMFLFQVTTSSKGPPPPRRDVLDGEQDTSRGNGGEDRDRDCSENESSEDDVFNDVTDQPRPAVSDGRILHFFAGDKKLVEQWGKTILNWNRHVFGGFDDDETGESVVSSEVLAASKKALVLSFHDLNSRGMFRVSCDLIVDCERAKKRRQPSSTRPPASVTTLAKALFADDEGSAKPEGPNVSKLSSDSDVTSPPPPIEGRPWWAFWSNKGSVSRRISAIPPT
ncbi:hypothetical protein PINS_up009540 [Pythium insidiosum]|nr:hypothetical protein PINS_up009540 [Pythium insidiosum]